MNGRSVFWKSRAVILITGIILVISAIAFLSTPKSEQPRLPSSEESATKISISTTESTAVTPAASADSKSEAKSESSVEYEPRKNSAPAQSESATATTPHSTETVLAQNPPVAPTPVSVSSPVPAPLAVEKSPSQSDSMLIEKVDFWIWAGLGVNYTTSSQSVDGFSDLEFGRIKSPSAMMRAGFYVSDKAGLELGFKSTPGEAKSSETVTVHNGDYTWLTMSAEGLYRTSIEPELTEWTWRLGVQQHQVPFMLPAGTNEISLTDASLTNLSLGFEYKKKLRKKLRFEWLMRYQYPIASSNNDATDFKIDPNISFDGSLGAAYQITEHTFVGIYWYGQYHDFAFSYQAPSSLQINGRQNLFFTNFDLRLGWEF